MWSSEHVAPGMTPRWASRTTMVRLESNISGAVREAGGKLEGSWKEAGGKLEGSWREAGGKLEGLEAGLWEG